MPTAGYELRNRIAIEGKRWTVCLKIHVVSELDDALDDWAGVRFLATITVWPPRLDEREERRVLRSGWYHAIKRRIAREGYRGRWRSSSGVGKWAHFEKPLPGVSTVRSEARRLERFSLALPSLFGSIGLTGDK
jgi:hypothetical protein